ncbi:unnamed protein product [Pseudo-nitzschia multistriata]|uniref:DNA polymerase alpha/delta/epsilon subunit B domain-containing protein n=1 Tax=Pseudo-nitzschia multistriata TaxID=183589 RepID=A0A448Z958_9STRA|nr:unnamed protein product [Pseudo-nitzschia multistriata]
MTVASPSGRQDRNDRPVRSFASYTPRWQRFQTQAGSTAGKNPTGKENAPTGGSNKSSSSSSTVRSSEQKVVPYQRQYSHVYAHRLAALKDRCWRALNRLPEGGSGGVKSVDRIIELKEDQLSAVVGTIVVESASGADGEEHVYYNDNDGDDEDRRLHPDAICRSGDQLFLEDESGRVAIRFVDDHRSPTNAKPRKSRTRHGYQYCTGVVVGVRGTVDDRGMMHVRDVADPALDPPERVGPGSGGSPRLLLVSSLLCGDPGVSSMPRDLLVSYLQGHLCDPDAETVARVVLAGSGPGAADPAAGLRELDLWGLQVTRTAGVPLDILPSATDPTTRNWPQRPLHSSLLPHTLRVDHGKGADPMARTTPNPYEASIGNRLVLGTDGLNVRDLQKHVLSPPVGNTGGGNGTVDPPEAEPARGPEPLTELEALERTLRWGHVCPSAPSSAAIGMVPSGDPMAMGRKSKTPSLYFCGNCEEGFATKLMKHDEDGGGEATTRLVCVPKFSETGEAVLVDLNTLEVELLRFKADT